tara:strand:+ start:154 stop:387 length:234 start_codon:yes stop_codon:yes gene_type:complete
MQKVLNDTNDLTLGFRQKITPPFISKSVAVFREKGFKAGLKSLGWKTLAAIFIFYLVRDVIIYILIPYFVAKGFFGF